MRQLAIPLAACRLGFNCNVVLEVQSSIKRMNNQLKLKGMVNGNASIEGSQYDEILHIMCHNCNVL